MTLACQDFLLHKRMKANLTNNQGRPVDENMHFCFERLCTWLESEVARYKQSVIQNEELDEIISQFFPGSFTQ